MQAAACELTCKLSAFSFLLSGRSGTVDDEVFEVGGVMEDMVFRVVLGVAILVVAILGDGMTVITTVVVATSALAGGSLNDAAPDSSKLDTTAIDKASVRAIVGVKAASTVTVVAIIVVAVTISVTTSTTVLHNVVGIIITLDSTLVTTSVTVIVATSVIVTVAIEDDSTAAEGRRDALEAVDVEAISAVLDMTGITVNADAEDALCVVTGMMVRTVGEAALSGAVMDCGTVCVSRPTLMACVCETCLWEMLEVVEELVLVLLLLAPSLASKVLRAWGRGFGNRCGIG